MVSPIIGKGLFFRIAPADRTALVCVLETDYVIDVDEVTRFTSIKTYGCIGLIAAVVEVFAVIAICNDA